MLNHKEIIDYVEKNISTFHTKKIDSLINLKLSKILKRKNPYLFKAKNVNTAHEIVISIVDAYVSSSEEGIFGDWLEGLAIHINNLAFNGRKSGIEGIDLEFDKNNVRYIVSIKSGPNWGNSTQHKKLKDYFAKAKKILRTSSSNAQVQPVLGICYGRVKNHDQGIYDRYVGQDFWYFISGDKNLYTKIINPIGHKAKENNQVYKMQYDKKINLFTNEFINEYCLKDGSIKWEKILKMNSESYDINF
jgi:hypothetical protein